MEVIKKQTHTQGPWAIEDCTPGESTGLRFTINSKDNVIARTTDGWKEAQANARLIAAAPEMLEMCKLLKECMETIDGKDGYDASYELAKVRAVLAKVEGETA
jgi:hypothetical protein|tara:strand:- start:329 stop:637 length:309 start_codon:yes stop_codon:yes gene_type:complete